MKFLEELCAQEKEVHRVKTENFCLEELRENERINIEKERLRIERIEDERIMMVDTSAMSESQKLFYHELQKEILARQTLSK